MQWRHGEVPTDVPEHAVDSEAESERQEFEGEPIDKRRRCFLGIVRELICANEKILNVLLRSRRQKVQERFSIGRSRRLWRTNLRRQFHRGRWCSAEHTSDFELRESG